jgi:hypothetical protein
MNLHRVLDIAPRALAVRPVGQRATQTTATRENVKRKRDEVDDEADQPERDSDDDMTMLITVFMQVEFVNLKCVSLLNSLPHQFVPSGRHHTRDGSKRSNQLRCCRGTHYDMEFRESSITLRHCGLRASSRTRSVFIIPYRQISRLFLLPRPDRKSTERRYTGGRYTTTITTTAVVRKTKRPLSCPIFPACVLPRQTPGAIRES